MSDCANKTVAERAIEGLADLAEKVSRGEPIPCHTATIEGNLETLLRENARLKRLY